MVIGVACYIWGSWFKSSHILFQFFHKILTVKLSHAHRVVFPFFTVFTADKKWYTPLKLFIFHLSQIFTHKQWYMGVKTKVSKIQGVFFSLSAHIYEVTLFLYLLRPWRTGGKNKMCSYCTKPLMKYTAWNVFGLFLACLM